MVNKRDAIELLGIGLALAGDLPRLEAEYDGPVKPQEPLYDLNDLIDEYNLIHDKKSALSRLKRDKVEMKVRRLAKERRVVIGSDGYASLLGW